MVIFGIDERMEWLLTTAGHLPRGNETGIYKISELRYNDEVTSQTFVD